MSILCNHIDYVLLITLYIKTAYLSCYVGFSEKGELGDCLTNPQPHY